MKERLYLFLGLFFMTIPAFAIEPATTAALIGAGISAISGIFGGMSASKQRREARRKEKAAAARRMELEANRQDIPSFGQEFENPYSNLQVATRASEIQAEQADISLASTLDTLRATGASAGGATALARAAAQSKRGVAASIEQQEAKNAQLRAQGEAQAAQMRQRAQMAEFQAQEARETQQLNRQASLESSFSQQSAAYGAQSKQMFGQAVGALGSFALQGGFKQGAFKNPTQNQINYNTGLTPSVNPGAALQSTGVSFNPVQVSNTTSLGGVTSFGSTPLQNAFPDIFQQQGFTFNPN